MFGGVNRKNGEGLNRDDTQQPTTINAIFQAFLFACYGDAEEKTIVNKQPGSKCEYQYKSCKCIPVVE